MSLSEVPRVWNGGQNLEDGPGGEDDGGQDDSGGGDDGPYNIPEERGVLPAPDWCVVPQTGGLRLGWCRDKAWCWGLGPQVGEVAGR